VNVYRNRDIICRISTNTIKKPLNSFILTKATTIYMYVIAYIIVECQSYSKMSAVCNEVE